jgi:anti-sigma B factor antagonist
LVQDAPTYDVRTVDAHECSVLRSGPAVKFRRTARADGVVVLAVAGEVDSLTSPDLRAALAAVLADPACRGLVLDLSGVSFLSSAGLSVLVTAREDAHAREVELWLAGASGNRAVRRPLELTGLFELFEHQTNEQGQPARG